MPVMSMDPDLRRSKQVARKSSTRKTFVRKPGGIDPPEGWARMQEKIIEIPTADGRMETDAERQLANWDDVRDRHKDCQDTWQKFA
jgi:hypothetical protein